jgi:hypothetical protein
MGTGGVKVWAKEANRIAENINQAIVIMNHEIGDSANVPQLKQVAPGEFILHALGKEWAVKISPRDQSGK